MSRTGLERIWTVPNVISFARLLTVPLFLWFLVVGADGPALLVLVVATTSDFIDGWIARRFNQVTVLGQRLDPASDRLFIAASVIGLAVRGLFPVPLLCAVLARDLVLLAIVLVRRIPVRDFPRVTMVGKLGTFVLFVAFPVIVLGTVFPVTNVPLALTGWVLGIAGSIIYWVAGFGYITMLLAGQTPTRTRSETPIH